MYKYLIISLFLLFSCSSQFTHGHESVLVDEIMENMEEPEWAIDRMLKNDMDKHPDMPKMIDRLSLQTQRLSKIKHPDKAFNEFTQELQTSLARLKTSLQQANPDFPQQWQQVKNACNNCHDIYE